MVERRVPSEMPLEERVRPHERVSRVDVIAKYRDIVRRTPDLLVGGFVYIPGGKRGATTITIAKKCIPETGARLNYNAEEHTGNPKTDNVSFVGKYQVEGSEVSSIFSLSSNESVNSYVFLGGRVITSNGKPGTEVEEDRRAGIPVFENELAKTVPHLIPFGSPYPLAYVLLEDFARAQTDTFAIQKAFDDLAPHNNLQWITPKS